LDLIYFMAKRSMEDGSTLVLACPVDFPLPKDPEIQVTNAVEDWLAPVMETDLDRKYQVPSLMCMQN